MLHDVSGAKPSRPSHNQLNCGTRCSMVCKCQGKKSVRSCPQEGDPACLAQGNLWQGTKNKPGVSPDPDMQFNCCPLQSQPLEAVPEPPVGDVTASLLREGNIKNVSLTSPPSKLKIKVCLNTLRTPPNFSSRSENHPMKRQLSVPRF